MISVAILCTNEQKCTDFYTKGMGMTVASRLDSARQVEIALGVPGGGTRITLIYRKSTEAVPAQAWTTHFTLGVPDMKALEARLVAAGYKLRGPITDRPQYRIALAFVEDPDGNVLELVQRK